MNNELFLAESQFHFGTENEEGQKKREGPFTKFKVCLTSQVENTIYIIRCIFLQRYFN